MKKLAKFVVLFPLLLGGCTFLARTSSTQEVPSFESSLEKEISIESKSIESIGSSSKSDISSKVSSLSSNDSSEHSSSSSKNSSNSVYSSQSSSKKNSSTSYSYSSLISSKSSSISSSSSKSSYSSSSSSKSSSSESSTLWDASQDYLRTGQKELNFYNFNDFHGATEYYNVESTYEPGIYKISSYLKELKNNDPDSYVLTSSGDMWQGSADSNLTKGKLVLDWMEYVGFEAMALGNHEFDWSIDTIKDNQEYKQNIPFLACNIIDKDTDEQVDWVKPYTTITRNGVHIGIIGAIGEGITSDIVQSNVKDVYFDDPTQYVIEASTYLKNNGADLILYLLHDSVYKVDSSLANYVDVVFGGHTHSGENTTLSSDIPMIQAYSNGRDLGHISLTYNFTTNSISYDEQGLVDFLYISLEEDAGMVNIYNTKYYDEIHAITDEVLGYTSEELYRSGGIEPYLTKYLYKYYINDLDGDKTITMVKHNVARSPIQAGNITYGSIYKSLPFDNYLVLVKIKGSVLNTKSNYFVTYSSTYDYYPKGKTTYKANQDYYVLTINYISEKYEYLNCYDVVEEYPSIFVRDIFARYVSEDFPVK